MANVILKPGREKPLLNRHPWVFSGAIERIEGRCADGDTVNLCDSQGHFLAKGHLNRRSQIAVRLLSWEAGEEIDGAFFRRRMERAIAFRKALIDEEATNAYRLVYAESDLLPGLIVDRYDRYLVVQFLTLGMDKHKEEIVPLLDELVQPRGIYERSDVEVREKEGLSLITDTLKGERPPDRVEIRENGHRFMVDIKAGQKTGFYLDQRDNRRRVSRYCSGREMLNAFSYTGSFAVYAAAAGATRITNIETSAEALGLARENMSLNGFAEREDEYVVGDVFDLLRRYRDQGRTFDLIVLDPPKFAYSQAQVQAACRGYKDINLLAMQLLRPEGTLCTFSCSGLVSPDLFQKVVFGASIDAGRDLQIMEKLSQASDHPILLSFPEGEYLKGLVCRVM